MKKAAGLLSLLAASACSGETPPSTDGVAEGIPAGEYRLDPSHASLVFRVDHLGFSIYMAEFETFDATLDFDPASPETMRVEASVDVSSLDLPTPPPGFHDELMGPQWFDAGAHPQMTFVSTKIDLTGAESADVTGDLTLKGVTNPVTLKVEYNGGWPGIEQDPNARIGFSAYGTLSRSAFGMDFGLPPEGSDMGVGDRVEILIETEFTGPPLDAG